MLTCASAEKNMLKMKIFFIFFMMTCIDFGFRNELDTNDHPVAEPKNTSCTCCVQYIVIIKKHWK